MPRRRFSRRARRRPRRFHRKSRFTRRVLRAEISNAPIKKATFGQLLGNTLVQGDATSRELYIFTPWSSLTQGPGDFQFEGNVIAPKGLGIKGLIYNAAATECYVRFTYFWSRTVNSYASNGTTYQSTTTATTNPAAASVGLANPQIFDDVSVAVAKYVGSTYASRFDRTQVRVIKTKTIRHKPSGDTSNATPFKFFFKHPRRLLKWQNTGEQSLAAAPNYPMNGQYYLIIQTFGVGGASNIASTTLASFDMWCFTYWKDFSG